jgi:hypothetical protein
MDYARLETAKLSDVDDTYYYGADCRSCLRSSRISLVRLRATLGDDFPLKDIRPRLKCTTCGSKAMVITFLSPNQAVGNLARLFQEKPV